MLKQQNFKIIFYNAKHFFMYCFWILLAFTIIGLFYTLIFNKFIAFIIKQLDNNGLSIVITAVVLSAPIFAVLETLTTWLKSIRENRIKSELIKVIDAQSKSPDGMDIYALERESNLPLYVLQARANELVLLGRLGVKLTPNNNRMYYLAK